MAQLTLKRRIGIDIGRRVSVEDGIEWAAQNDVQIIDVQTDIHPNALESFDATGGWRDTESGAPVDNSAVLPDGTQFQGPAGLRAYLVTQRRQFVTALTEKLLAYALGRSIEYYDLPTVRSIVRDAASSDYQLSAIVLGIVKSPAFRMRRAVMDASGRTANASIP